jgi:Ran GTPase-activating protein (RanGAP) involved in mRNA processing and transport
LVLSLRDNSIATKDGGKALAQALASSSTLKELDVSDNWKGGGGPGFAQELAGAMTSLNLALNNLRVKGATIIGEAIKVIKWVIAVVLVSI